MERRNTVQRNLVLEAVQDLHGHVTADEVYEKIAAQHPHIGKGTVYRNLNILAEAGDIRRVEISTGPDRFDFTTREHYHVRCVRCQQVEDVDLDALPDLIQQIRDTHGYAYLGYDILFRGICPACLEKMKEKGNEFQSKRK